MALVGFAVGRYGRLHGFHVPFDRVSFIPVPYASLLGFVVLVVMGLNKRRDLQRHKRLIVLGTLSVVGAATGRIPQVVEHFSLWFDPTLLLIPLVLWDIATQRKVLPVTIWGGLFVIITDLGALPFGLTAVWHTMMAPFFGTVH